VFNVEGDLQGNVDVNDVTDIERMRFDWSNAENYGSGAIGLPFLLDCVAHIDALTYWTENWSNGPDGQPLYDNDTDTPLIYHVDGTVDLTIEGYLIIEFEAIPGLMDILDPLKVEIEELDLEATDNNLTYDVV
jgi:hypothetical protein